MVGILIILPVLRVVILVLQKDSIGFRLNLEITIPAWAGWFRGTQIVIMIFVTIGAVISHLLLTLHLKISYWESGYSLGSRYCPKCGNRFLVLTPNNTDANLYQEEDLK